MVVAEAVQQTRHTEDELNPDGVLGAGETIDIGTIIDRCQMNVSDMSATEYEDFHDDLLMLGISAAQFGRDIGLSKNTVYSWKHWMIPQYARAYMHARIELADLKARLNK